MHHRQLLTLSLLSLLLGCSQSPTQAVSPKQQQDRVISTFQQVERQVQQGTDPQQYPILVVQVNEAIARLPEDTPPRVTQLLEGSASAYTLAYRYWQCDQKKAGAERAVCQDSELEKIVTRFPHIKRNITNRLVIRPNPPAYLSESITTQNMVRLLLMQASLNRVDAHLILTGGDFEEVYSLKS
jgi:hypothetical protein